MESTLELTKIKEVLQKNLKILIILPLLFLIISAIITFFVYHLNIKLILKF